MMYCSVLEGHTVHFIYLYVNYLLSFRGVTYRSEDNIPHRVGVILVIVMQSTSLPLRGLFLSLVVYQVVVIVRKPNGH